MTMSERGGEMAVEGLRLNFGGQVVLDDVGLSVPAGTITGIVGPNGAGKSSLLNCVNGFYRPSRGSIELDGRQLIGERPHRIARLGLARTFQNLEVIGEATVLENVMLGRHVHIRHSIFTAAMYWGPAARHESRHRAKAEEVIELLDLEALRHTAVGSLSYGQQKRVEIARALASEPRFLMLDEPTSGMNREEKEDVARYMIRLKHERPITQVLIEHDLGFVSDLCDHVAVLNFGRVIAEGTVDEAFGNPEVVRAYVGSPK